MDPVAAARRLVATLGTTAVTPLVAAEARDFVAAAPQAARVLDMVMRRNLVFLSYQASDRAGTWALSFDREGRLIAWAEMA